MKSWMLAAGLTLALLAAPARADQPTADPPYPTAQNPAKPFWARRVTGMLPTRDGTKLRFSALLPAGSGPFPVVINYSGYDPGAIGGPAYLTGDTAMSTNLDRTLVEHGYAVVGVQARGTGCSEGTFGFLLHHYGEDGADAVEWLARQAWSNGRIAMANWSWAGMSQIATASERPPHLVAIAPGMVIADPRLDSWYPGGVPAPGFIANWWGYRASRWAAVKASALAEGDAVCAARVDLNTNTAEPYNLSNLVLQHPLRDGWSEEVHLGARTHNITVPVLSMEAFQDEAVTSREGYYQETLDPEKLWMVQTNGGHDLYESLVWRRTLVAFFDHFVKGVSNGFEAGPHVTVWMESSAARAGDHTGDETSAPRYTFTLPRYITSPPAMRSFALGAGGALQETAAAESKPDSFAYPSPAVQVNTPEGSTGWGPLPVDWRKGSVAYTSAALPEAMLAYGPASADLWLSTNAPDADVQVTLTEVRPDGQEVYVQRGWLRLSDRAIDAERSTLVHVVLKDRPETTIAMPPGEPVPVRIELNKLAHAFRAGSRLRLWIESPSATGGYGFNINAMPATTSIWHDQSHPSRLVLGVIIGANVPPLRPECGKVLGQPCRADPLAGH